MVADFERELRLWFRFKGVCKNGLGLEGTEGDNEEDTEDGRMGL